MNTDRERASGPGLAWPFPPALVAFWYSWLAWSWWTETREQLQVAAADGALAGVTMSVELMACGALFTRLLATLTETGVYTLWWRGRGARLPYWRLLCWVATFSGTDLFGISLRRAATDAPAFLHGLAAALGGPGVVDGPVATGAMAAFGNLGVLTLLRVGMTGWAQARSLGRPLTGPLALTVAAWLLTRVTSWWSFDLLRGLSPVR
ncbi:MAG: hypothetical protein E6K81_08965 [Candidatus Eisenbacteria bacterium]|uniref:Yip1 domain-containing protein n=1 Tax=Eiseniibacteriota bacterium TaxID=2212470 RepID=A0A538U7M2_UNCEI|nr:MAG: hypothetical protein E6K81_08965 [Candidatus Eisenbacteria bacterium]